MNRRLLIKNLTLFSGGVLLLPSCLVREEEKNAPGEIEHFSLSKGQEAVLAEFAETMIPTTGTPGAKLLGLHLFVLTMVRDCYEREEQENFVDGLNQFDATAKNKFGSAFVECNKSQRYQLLTALEAKEAVPEVLSFYTIAKNEIIKGFLNSKLVMTELRRYELVPARYNGYFPVKSA